MEQWDTTAKKNKQKDCTNGQIVDLESFLIQICMEQKHILNVYVGGSRAYGNNTASSDWDIFTIAAEDSGRRWKPLNWLYDHGWLIHNPYAPLKVDCQRDFIGCDTFQTWIYTPKTWQALINAYAPFAVQCLFFPQQNVWKETVKFTLPSPIDKKKLFYSFAGVAELHFQRARLEFKTEHAEDDDEASIEAMKRIVLMHPGARLQIQNWNIAQSKKTLHHALRYLEFGAQLAEKGVIYDITAANKSKKVLLDVVGDKWVDHLQVFAPLYETALDRFKSL